MKFSRRMCEELVHNSMQQTMRLSATARAKTRCLHEHSANKTLDTGLGPSYAQDMEIQLTAEQEALLSQVASNEGKPVGQLLTECAAYVLRGNDRFLAEVEEGLAAAERGEFIEEDEMDARVEAMLKR